MKVLLIIRDIDNSALGLVGKSLIKELSKVVDLDVLYSNGETNVKVDNVNKYYRLKYPTIPIRLYWGVMKVFKCSLFDEIWARVGATIFANKKSYDIIFDIVSILTLDSLLLGHFLSQRLEVKHAVYFVDAIPAKGWSYNINVSNTLKSIVKKTLPSADYFASCNKKMLDYQLTTFTPKATLKSSVIYLPTDTVLHKYPNSSKFNFLYTGKIYANRTLKYMLGAFEKFHNIYKESRFIFVGTHLDERQLAYITTSIKSNVQIFDFVKELAPFYEDATVLVDIDANLEDDVFLSSKIVKYLAVNRIILSETGKHSPSRELFKGINSIIQCGHDVDEIYTGMLSCVERINTIDFSDREVVRSLFDTREIVKKIVEDFSVII